MEDSVMESYNRQIERLEENDSVSFHYGRYYIDGVEFNSDHVAHSIVGSRLGAALPRVTHLQKLRLCFDWPNPIPCDIQRIQRFVSTSRSLRDVILDFRGNAVDAGCYVNAVQQSQSIESFELVCDPDIFPLTEICELLPANKKNLKVLRIHGHHGRNDDRRARRTGPSPVDYYLLSPPLFHQLSNSLSRNQHVKDLRLEKFRFSDEDYHSSNVRSTVKNLAIIGCIFPGEPAVDCLLQTFNVAREITWKHNDTQPRRDYEKCLFQGLIKSENRSLESLYTHYYDYDDEQPWSHAFDQYINGEDGWYAEYLRRRDCPLQKLEVNNYSHIGAGALRRPVFVQALCQAIRDNEESSLTNFRFFKDIDEEIVQYFLGLKLTSLRLGVFANVHPGRTALLLANPNCRIQDLVLEFVPGEEAEEGTRMLWEALRKNHSVKSIELDLWGDLNGLDSLQINLPGWTIQKLNFRAISGDGPCLIEVLTLHAPPTLVEFSLAIAEDCVVGLALAISKWLKQGEHTCYLQKLSLAVKIKNGLATILEALQGPRVKLRSLQYHHTPWPFHDPTRNALSDVEQEALVQTLPQIHSLTELSLRGFRLANLRDDYRTRLLQALYQNTSINKLDIDVDPRGYFFNAQAAKVCLRNRICPFNAFDGELIRDRDEGELSSKVPLGAWPFIMQRQDSSPTLVFKLLKELAGLRVIFS